MSDILPQDHNEIFEEHPLSEDSAPLIDTLLSSFGEKLEFPIFDLTDQKQPFYEAVLRLGQHELDRVAVLEQCSELSEAIYKKHALAWQAQRRNAIMRNTVIIPAPQEDEDGQPKVIEQPISRKDRDAFCQILGSMDLQTAKDESVIITDAQIERALELIAQDLADKVASICQDIPAPDEADSCEWIDVQVTERIVRPGSLFRKPETQKHILFAFITSHPKYIKIQRKMRDLIESIHACTDNFEDLVADKMVSMSEEEVERLTQYNLDTLLAVRNSDVYEQLRSSKKKIRPESLDVAEQSEDVAEPAQEIAEAVRADHSQEYEHRGNIEVQLPWMNQGQATEVELFEFTTISDSSIYVVRALNETLTDIAQTARDKISEGLNGSNQYDSIIQKIAERIASGVMPYQNTRSQRALKSERTANYKDLKGIWYHTTVRNNAPRVYFSFIDRLDDVAASVLPPGIDKNKLCVMILAETDKAQQIAALQQLTTQSHTQLAAYGAGSI